MDWNSKVLIVQKWCAYVKIFDINTNPLQSGGRDSIIHEDFGLSHI